MKCLPLTVTSVWLGHVRTNSRIRPPTSLPGSALTNIFLGDHHKRLRFCRPEALMAARVRGGRLHCRGRRLNQPGFAHAVHRAGWQRSAAWNRLEQHRLGELAAKSSARTCQKAPATSAWCCSAPPRVGTVNWFWGHLTTSAERVRLKLSLNLGSCRARRKLVGLKKRLTYPTLAV